MLHTELHTKNFYVHNFYSTVHVILKTLAISSSSRMTMLATFSS